MNKEPFIKIKESGKNFKMIDSEVQMGSSNKPFIETAAENTKLIRVKFNFKKQLKEHPIKTFVIALILIIIGLIIEYSIFK